MTMRSAMAVVVSFFSAIVLVTAVPNLALAGPPFLSPPQACSGGAVPAMGGGCACANGYATYHIGEGSILCVPQIDSTCTGGTMVGGQCQCPVGDNAQRTGNGIVRCIPPPPIQSCTGGEIIGNQCVCPAGDMRYTSGSANYRCIARKVS